MEEGEGSPTGGEGTPSGLKDRCAAAAPQVSTCDCPVQWVSMGWSVCPEHCELLWDCRFEIGAFWNGYLPNAGHRVKSGQMETLELLSKMSWPVFCRRSSR